MNKQSLYECAALALSFVRCDRCDPANEIRAHDTVDAILEEIERQGLVIVPRNVTEQMEDAWSDVNMDAQETWDSMINAYLDGE